ncbi:MAG: PEP/pyruvate-binding domain-containing protein [Bacteroidia bacterium]
MAYYFFDPAGSIPPVSLIGSKAFNLCRMVQSGIHVPPFFVITAESLAVPDKLDKTALEEAFDRLAGGEGFVSVRSSASIEDGAAFSFAGQFYTGLFVDKKNLHTEIKKCLDSASGSNIGAYMRLNKMEMAAFPFAIVVQKMIHATRSGIGFSMRPGGNLANMCIVAGYGAGEGVVMSKVETDTYLLNRNNRELQKTIVKKTEQFSFDGQAHILPMEEGKMLEPALSDSEIQEVGDMLLKTEKLLGLPADIEFCMDENGALFLLQMRPITGMQTKNIRILDNTNIIESYPGITLPLTYDFARDAYAKLFRSSARAFWVTEKEISKLHDVFENLIAHIEGRIYYRLDNWYRMLARVHRSKGSLRDWENAVGLRDSEIEQILPGFKGKLRAYTSSIWLILTWRSGNRSFYRKFDREYAKLRNLSACGKDAGKLWQHYERHTRALFSFWYPTIVNDFIAFQSFAWVQSFLKKAGAVELANDLVASESGVASEEAIIEVLHLKGLIQKEKQLGLFFDEEDTVILTGLLEGKFPAFSLRFFAYLDQYGDRTLAELKLETPSPRRFPLLLVHMLKQQLQSAVSADDFLKKKTAIREAAIKRKNSLFPWWNPKCYALNGCLALARYGLKNRENMRFCRTRAYGAVKDIFLEIGKIMVERGQIEEESAIFYLDLEEVKAFCIGQENKDLSLLIRQRKARYQEAEKLRIPDRIMYSGDLPDFGETDIEHPISGNEMQGIGVSPGTVTAEALVTLLPGFDMEVKNRVLVSKMTDPGWVFLMSQASALVSEKGSLLSHTAIVGRELGIPVVVNIPGATQRIQSGDLIRVDGTKGTVRIKNETRTKNTAHESD